MEQKNEQHSGECDCRACLELGAHAYSVFTKIADHHGLSSSERRLFAQDLNDMTGLNLG